MLSYTIIMKQHHAQNYIILHTLAPSSKIRWIMDIFYLYYQVITGHILSELPKYTRPSTPGIYLPTYVYIDCNGAMDLIKLQP
jgi:hypothetical protein